MVGKVVKIAVWVCLLMISSGVAAQFSISRSSQTTGIKELGDTIRQIIPLENDFFNRAKWQADRKALRKQRNNWEFNTALQMSQTQFENWAGGGDNTFSGRWTLFVRHRYKRDKFTFESKVEAKYGLNYIEGQSYKNEDEFKINLVSGWQMHEYWSYAASANLRSQFATGYKSRKDKTRKSTLMAPGFLDMSLGFKYSRNPTFSAIISPVAGSAVFMFDDELSALGLNGVPKNSRSKWSVGPSLRVDLDKVFAKKVIRLRSSLYSFCNLKNPPTVRWETTLDIRATKFLSTTLYGMIYYDKEANTPKFNSLQYKYSLAVGLTYTFKTK